MPTRQERDERRKIGLYMWYVIKFTRGHNFFKSQLYHILLETDNGNEEGDELYLDCEESIGSTR